jgi:hypothetical protein
MIQKEGRMSLERELVRDLNRYAGVPAAYHAVDGSIVLGLYTMECYSETGQLIWREQFYNNLVNVGVILMMDHTLQTAITIVGPFLGLIGGAGAPTIANTDTMAAHAGWLEGGLANPPTYTAPRKTTVGQWSAAAVRTKALSTPQSFAITGTGTVQGAFMVTGAGAVSTLDSTAGTLFSAGPFSGGGQPVVNLNTLSVSWSLVFS